MGNKNVDMTKGPFLKKIILFSLPIMVSGILQMFFNAADTVIVGQFSADGDLAISAVGSTGSVINALIALAMGMSNGAGVIVAQNTGAKNSEAVKNTVHTAMLLSLICGIVLGIIGIILAPSVLKLISTPASVLPLATVYLRIYFAGLPVQLVYNFGSSILRAIGDTVRPLIFLLISGVLNVGLNIVFVILFNMSVAGVALATVISQSVSALLVVIYMIKQKNDCKLSIKKLGINLRYLSQILYIGIPAGIQGMIFSVSNVIMQSTINSFGPLAMSGSAATTSVANFIFIPMNSIHHASTTVIGQNTGAKKFEQVKKLTRMLLLIVATVGAVLSFIIVGLGKNLIGIYTDTPEAINFGMIHLFVMASPYFICGCMDVIVGCIRGMGTSLSPMLISIFGVCGLRLVWIWGIFPLFETMGLSVDIRYTLLFLSYPISWTITFISQLIVYNRTYKKLVKRYS